MSYIPSESNVADLASKHWAYNKVWEPIIRPIFNWAGETLRLLDCEEEEYEEEE